MRGGRGSNGAATDFLVCFPSRAHLSLMPPKTICSPSRPSSASDQPARRRHSTSRAGPPSSSAHFRVAAAASRNSSRRRAVVDVPVDDEPSSPKVTCAGQIKVRSAKPKGDPAGTGGGGAGKAKKATWMQALGIKKDALPFLNALHGAFRLNVAGCFGSFPGAVEYTSGEDEEDEEEEEEEERAGKDTAHGAALSKWFMVLEERKKVPRKKQDQEPQEEEEEEGSAPPANALMLMRCRSAPAKGLARRLGGDHAEQDEEVKCAAKKATEEEEQNLVLMRYPPDFFQVSVDIAKETWIVGGDDSILRCRSWKK